MHICIYVCVYGQDGDAALESAFLTGQGQCLCLLGCRRIGRMADETFFQKMKPLSLNPKT